MLWIPITFAACLAQVLRNGAQASLTGKIGTLGATQVRFVFGLPFALLFLLIGLGVTGESLPGLNRVALAWGTLGAVAQIAATALMLLVMHRRAFGVAYAYIKTEPVIVALLGVLLLGDHLPLLGWIGLSGYKLPVDMFGVVWPALPVGFGEKTGHEILEFHATLGGLMILLVGLHILAVIKHLVIDRDGNLWRMLPFGTPKG